MKTNLQKIVTALLIYLGASMAVSLIIALITYSGWLIKGDERHIYSFFIYHYIYHFKLAFSFLAGLALYALVIRHKIAEHYWPGTLVMLLLLIVLLIVLIPAAFTDGEGIFYSDNFSQ
ncbi:MAG: hypothetical protein B6D77_17910 [gamma proteobacterium symbiont of Ctena orbiculata]|nr:MAG: hypothetical protein B6D77_17910 [gamma proteobacterium symbiont of Ctena orbiculata]